MVLTEMRSQFNENINLMLQTKRDDNKSFLNVDEYKKRICEVKEAKTMLLTPGSKKTTKHYRLVRKYDVITLKGEECLIKPVAGSAQSKVLYYARNEELFDIIHNSHLAIGHGGRNRMVVEINKAYCNVTKETIMVYLRLCTHCQKKSSTPKKGLVSRPIPHSIFNSRAQIDLIDMQSQSYDGFRFIMVYQDHLTKFVLLKALKTKSAEEVAHHLLEIYTTFGAPIILQSNNGREFVSSVLVDLHAVWPEVKIVHGDPPPSQETPEPADIEETVGAWMVENHTRDWPSGTKFIQFKKNRTLHPGIGKSPYEAMFGCAARAGLVSTGIPYNDINNLSTEEDAASLLKEMNGESKELKDNQDEYGDGIEERKFSENIDYKENIFLENVVIKSENYIDPSYQDGIVCNQCFTLLHFGNQVNDGGICVNCEQANISNECKRSRESLDEQVPKMLKSDVQIGTTVCVPIPDVDKARGSPCDVLAVVTYVEDGRYKLCTENGVLKHTFARSEFSPCAERLISLENLSDAVKAREITLSQAAAENSILERHSYNCCHCKGGCKNNKCACRANKIICNSKCHGSLSCHNKNDHF